MPCKNLFLFCLLIWLGISCKSEKDPGPSAPAAFGLKSVKVNEINSGLEYENVSLKPKIRFTFSTTLNSNSIKNGITLKTASGNNIPFSGTLENGDSSVVIEPAATLQGLNAYVAACGRNERHKQRHGRQQGNIGLKKAHELGRQQPTDHPDD